MYSDPPGKPTPTITYMNNPQLDIKGIWLENRQYTIRCYAASGNPKNKYRLMINGKIFHDSSDYTITAHKELHQSVLTCDVYNKFTEDKQTPKSVTYTINVHCKSGFAYFHNNATP